MEEAIVILKEFGAMGIWGIIIYQMLDIIKNLVIFSFIGYGLKKAWPTIKKIII